MTPDRKFSVEIAGLTKTFKSLNALDNVNLSVKRGEIRAVLGENGAGKSTLLKILSGVQRPSSGTISIHGVARVIGSPLQAEKLGIAAVHQHFVLVPNFTVIQNLQLALPANLRSFWISRSRAVARATEAVKSLGWDIPFESLVHDLPVGTQQRIEILKTIMRGADIFLFDEPTAVLAPDEITDLFQVIRRLAVMGKTILFVTHKLDEVMELCDSVTVLRRGERVFDAPIAQCSKSILASKMIEGTGVPRPDISVRSFVFQQSTSREPHEDADSTRIHATIKSSNIPRLEFLSVSTSGGTGVNLNGISFSVGAGEIIGFAGVDGNGQSELAEVITGTRTWSNGSIAMDGNVQTEIRPSQLTELGIAYVPPDRQNQGLALSLSIRDNLSLLRINSADSLSGPFLKRSNLNRHAELLARQFDIRAASLSLPVSSLSGGNQQKIVLARAIDQNPRLLVVVSPTRGLDIGATSFVHQCLLELKNAGAGIVLISTELDEIIALSDRVAVLVNGSIAGFIAPDASRSEIGLLMGSRVVRNE